MEIFLLKSRENSCFSECSIIVVSIIELTVYTLDDLIFDLCVSKNGFVLCSFAIYDIGMKIVI